MKQLPRDSTAIPAMGLGVSLPAYPWMGGVDSWDSSKAWVGKHCDQVGFPRSARIYE